MNDEEENIDGNGRALLCIARRMKTDDKHLSKPLEQFSFKLDLNGEILGLDTKHISDGYAQYLTKVKFTIY